MYVYIYIYINIYIQSYFITYNSHHKSRAQSAGQRNLPPRRTTGAGDFFLTYMSYHIKS